MINCLFLSESWAQSGSKIPGSLLGHIGSTNPMDFGCTWYLPPPMARGRSAPLVLATSGPGRCRSCLTWEEHLWGKPGANLRGFFRIFGWNPRLQWTNWSTILGCPTFTETLWIGVTGAKRECFSARAWSKLKSEFSVGFVYIPAGGFFTSASVSDSKTLGPGMVLLWPPTDQWVKSWGGGRWTLTWLGGGLVRPWPIEPRQRCVCRADYTASPRLRR